MRDPTGSTGARSRRATVISLFGTIALVALLNLLAGLWLERSSPNLGYRLIRAKWHALRTLEAPVDWLILGDSSGNQGLRPDVLERALGGRALNLCTIADTLTLNDAWMLREYLSRFPPPRAVVVVHVYDVWRRSPNVSVLAQAPMGLAAWVRLKPRPPLDSSALIERLATRLLPIYSESHSLKELMRRPTLRRPDLPSSAPDGFMAVTQANPARVLEQKTGHLEFVRSAPFKMSAANRSGLEEMIRLAEEKGFDLWLTPSPMYEGLYREPDFQTYYGALLAELDALSRRHPRVRVLMRAPPLFSPDQMENADHVVGEAALAYSERVASALLAAAPSTASISDRVIQSDD